MKKLYLLLSIITIGGVVNAQDPQVLFSKALSFQQTNDIDSALAILESITNDPEAENDQLTLLAKLQIAKIKVKAGKQAVENIEALHHLVEIATKQEEWSITAEAYIILGFVNEKNDHHIESKEYLDRAYSLIQQHQLQTLLSKYLVRRAATFRRFTSYADSIIHYARKALEYAVEEDNETKGEAYYELGHMLGQKPGVDGIDYFRKALVHYRKIGDYDNEVKMYLEIAEDYYERNQLDSAIVYYDLAKLDFNKITLGNLARIFLSKAQIYKQQGKIDSAWHFYTLSYEARLEELEQENRKAITFTEEQFQAEQRNQQIEQQKLALGAEKQQKNQVFVIALVLLLLVGLITYFYFRLRKVSEVNREQAERLKHLDASKSRFFANASHELRTPLTLMLGPVNKLLKGNGLSNQQVKLLQTAAQSGQQLQQLINEILDLRKLELGKLTLNLQLTKVYSFFVGHIAQFESLAESKGITYEQKIEIDESVVAKLDREKCRQILHNLLSNAFKFTSSGGQVSIAIEEQENQLSLSVSDTGKGIHPDDVPYIFDRYFQTNQLEKPIEGGTGIGLALCKEYVELLGGEISVSSTLDQGTTFRLFFPITLIESGDLTDKNLVDSQPAIEQAITLPTITSSLQKGSPEKPHLLIVEDNPALSDYLALILSGKYEITTAENGQQALDHLFTESDGNKPAINKYQLILSDLMMPVMDGYQLLEKLKSHDATRHIPVVMLTARAELRDKLKALRIGVDDYLVKPFEEEELLVRIQNLLQNQSNRKEETYHDVKQSEAVALILAEDQIWLIKFEQFIQKNISNSLLSVPMLEKEFSMSKSSLFRQVKGLTGLSPAQYIKEVRLEKALRLLENNRYNSIAKVAYEVGYSGLNSFTRAFKLRFGKPPSEFLID